MNHRTEYLGQRSFRLKVIVQTHKHRHTNMHTEQTDCPTRTTKWSTKIAMHRIELTASRLADWRYVAEPNVGTTCIRKEDFELQQPFLRLQSRLHGAERDGTGRVGRGGANSRRRTQYRNLPINDSHADAVASHNDVMRRRAND